MATDIATVGLDRITIPAGGEINNLKNYTMEFIFYHGGVGGANKGRLWDKGVFHIYVDTYWSAINRLYIERDTNSGGTEGWATPQGSLNAGEWYYVQLTWDVASAGIGAPMIYINNVLQILTHTSVASGVWADDSHFNALIGNNEAGDRWLNAKLSMFKLHRTSISDWQLSEEYYKNMWRCDPTKDNCQVEFTRWPSSGTTIINTSGTGATYNGTATNEDYDTLPGGSNIWKFKGD